MHKVGSSRARPRDGHRPKAELELPATTAATSVSIQDGGSCATSWASHLPPSWLPYVELARLTMPAALILIYSPTLFGVVLAAVLARESGRGAGNPNTAEKFHFPNSWWYTCLLLFVASFFFSNAAHAWNDLVDAPIDILVPRTARRPIPRGAVSRPAAFAFTLANAAATAVVLLAFPDPAGALRYALPNILGTVYYPYAKRHTNLPQLVLGVCLAWGIVMGAVAVGCEPFALGDMIRLQQPGDGLSPVFSPHHPISHPATSTPLTSTWWWPSPQSIPTTVTLDLTSLPLPFSPRTLSISTAFLTLFTASALWSVIYDTIYAADDVDADLRHGVGSLAVLCYRYAGSTDAGQRLTKAVLGGLVVLLGACLVICGMVLPGSGGGERGGGAGWLYYVVAPGGCVAALGAMVSSVDLGDAKSTRWWFTYGLWLVVGAVLGGFGCELLA